MNITLRAGGLRGPRRTATLACAALLSAAALLAGCSGGPAQSAGPAGQAAGAAAAPGVHGAAAEPASGPAPGTQASATQASGTRASGTDASSVSLSTQSIVYTASLTVQAENVSAAAARATGIVIAEGGYVSGEQASLRPAGGARPAVSLQLKIPVAVYQPTLSRLSTGLGTQVSLTEHARDVTQQVADTASLVSSAQAGVTQLQALLKRAGSVSALLTVQDQISAQESSLEALQAQARALARETSYATVSVTLVSQQRRHAVKAARRRHGFAAGFAAGWRGLRLAVSALLTTLGAALPFLVIGAAAAAGYAGRRRVLRLLRRRSGPTAAG